MAERITTFRSRSDEPSFSQKIWNKAAITPSRADIVFAKEILAASNFFHNRADLKTISTPTVFIGCPDDVAILPGTVKEACKLVPGSVFRKTKNGSHAAIVEVPEQIAQIILESV